MKKYTVVFEHDERDWWVASVRELSGCHTQGRSIRQARERIREALSLFGKDPDRVRLVEDVKLPATVRRTIQRQQAGREKAEKELARAQATTKDAVRLLTGGLHLSVRDVGEILRLSHQRVQQLRS